MANRFQHLNMFYRLLHELEQYNGGARLLSETDGYMRWPQRAVYFLRDPEESLEDTGIGSRVVYVGTHGQNPVSYENVWRRISYDRGVRSSGGGSHRHSKIRLHVGTSLINRHALDYPKWGSSSQLSMETKHSELPLERSVSEVLGRMQCVWLSVSDPPGPGGMRQYLMENAIALLSNSGKHRLNPPTKNWLGYSCSAQAVRTSGLWNHEFTSDRYDPNFINTFKRLVRDRAPVTLVGESGVDEYGFGRV